MSLTNLLTQFQKVREDIVAGKYATAWEDTLPIQQGMIDLARAIGFKATPDDVAAGQQIIGVICDCESILQAAPKEVEATKFGDGTFLKLLLEFLKTIAPIVIPILI